MGFCAAVAGAGVGEHGRDDAGLEQIDGGCEDAVVGGDAGEVGVRQSPQDVI